MRYRAVLLLAGLVCLLAVTGARLRGDGGEYLLMAHAFAYHATPELRLDDATWLRAHAPRLRSVAKLIRRGMRHERLTPIPAIRRSDQGGYYSIHFWLYSLLAAPFLWLTEAAGLAPEAALGAVNGLAASAAVVALWAYWDRSRYGLAAGALFVLCGTTFYLGWSGPEALTGAAVVCSVLAARRGKLGLGLLAAGVAAAQNASAVALVPYALWCWWRRERRLRARDVVLGTAAALLLGLPYAFFYAHYRVPSVLGHFAVSPELISGERAWSFVFDLNQGLVLGVPALILGLPVIACVTAVRAPPPARPALALDAAELVVLAVAMAVPTLAVHNWNAGNSVIIRYGYWCAMPLVVLLLELLARLDTRPRWTLAGAVAALQLAAIVPFGFGADGYVYLRHTWLAELVMRHAPGAYNPNPEIFYERSLGREAPVGAHKTVVWPSQGEPAKLMTRARRARSRRICPRGTEITSAHVHRVGSDWRYLDAPFTCVKRGRFARRPDPGP